MFTYLKSKFKKISLAKMLIIALLVRLLVAPFFFHSDLNNHAIWGIYAQEFGFRGFYDWLNFGNYAWPGYPPFAHFIFLGIRLLWQFLFNIFWYLNVKIALFPSNFIPWFKDPGYLTLLKLPGIIADIAIGYLIYIYVTKRKNVFTGKLMACMFLFNPAIIYLSSVWGQLESIISLFVLISAVFLMNKKYISATLSYLISLMVKVTTIVATPIFLLQAIKRRIKKEQLIASIAVVMVVSIFAGFVFYDKNYLSWFINLYLKLSKGPDTLLFINLNAFNFWGVIFGLERLADSTIYLGLPIKYWAWGISGLLFSIIILKSYKSKELFFPVAMMFFTAFMFMPRVHERYLYPVFVFFPLILIKFPKLIKIFVILSIIFFINLYHWWWVPRVDFLASLFDFEIVERGLCFINLAIFIYLFNIYLKKT